MPGIGLGERSDALAAGAHLQGFEQLLDRRHDLLLPSAAAHHRQALRDRLLRALAGVLLAACV